MLQVGSLSTKFGARTLLKGGQHSSPSSAAPSSASPSNLGRISALNAHAASSSNLSRGLIQSRSARRRQYSNLQSKHFASNFTRTTKRWKSDNTPKNDSSKEEANELAKDEPFATDTPQNRDEIVREAKSFKKQFDEALAKLSAGKEHEGLSKNPDSWFSGYRKTDGERNEAYGMTPRESGIANAESLRSAHDLKLTRNTVLRKTMWYSLSELTFDMRAWGYIFRERKLILLYAALTAALLGYAILSPNGDYDFFNKKEFEEQQRRRREKEALERTKNNSNGEGEDSSIIMGAISSSMDSLSDFVSNFSIFEPFRKVGYLIGGTIVSLRMLKATWAGDPLSEDERLLVAHTPVSLAKDLRPDEYHHVSPLLRIMATGHVPSEPWSALIPPSPWAPHLTVVVETELLYSIGYNERGQKVLRKRPFADYFLSSLSENAEIILSSAHHSKTSAKHFFKLFDPYSVASHTFTAEDHRWNGMSWMKPLEERYIGRRPDRLVVLDADRSHCGAMCENVLRVQPWQGNSSDTTFLELTPIIKCT